MVTFMWIFKNSGFILKKKNYCYLLYLVNYVGYILCTRILFTRQYAGCYIELDIQSKCWAQEEGNLPKCHQLQSELKALKTHFHSLYVPETRPLLSI